MKKCFGARAGDLLGALLLAVLITACSAGKPSVVTDATVGGDQGCGPGSCPGCCLGDICLEGKALSACGGGGLACVECIGGMICQQGACRPRDQGCSSANCGDGCCAGDTCRSGVGNDACGTGGEPCVDCAASGGVCSAATRTCLSSCVPDCSGKCRGADDGCGGKCAINDCQGCCEGQQCLQGVSDRACGSAGSECADCTGGGGICNAGSCSQCTPNCSGKCAGASDGCGNLCATNSCSGCCDATNCVVGNELTACGRGGVQCADCSQSGGVCSGGVCSGCSANCAGKCPGASDGCGGTCSANLCSGCCDDTTCLGGDSDTACGSAGAACEVCPADFDGYKWTCKQQVCTKDTPTSGVSCVGQTGGILACTENSVPGKCWDGACCTGCYDSLFQYCWRAINDGDDTCGNGGASCVDCTQSGLSCVDYQCTTSSGPCAGLAPLDDCQGAGGDWGVCVAGECCTGCYYSDGGTTRCQAAPTDARCGVWGTSCSACDPFESCDGDVGFCDIRPDARFELILDRGTIEQVAGKEWDSLIGDPEPDVFVALDWSSSCSALSPDECSASVSNSYEPVWDQSFGIFTADTLMSEFCVLVLDTDGIACAPSPFETIGRCTLKLGWFDFYFGNVTLDSCANPNDGVDYVSSLRFKLIYKP